MKLIVNEDDFGLSSGVSRGILEAHPKGILTSASLMVEAPASEDAAHLASSYRSLGVGLHAVIDTAAKAAPRHAVERQLERFIQLTRQLATRLDSHHDVHHEPGLLAALSAVAQRHALPLEELESSYLAEREAELHTLREGAVLELLRELDIRLATFREVPAP